MNFVRRLSSATLGSVTVNCSRHALFHRYGKHNIVTSILGLGKCEQVLQPKAGTVGYSELAHAAAVDEYAAIMF